MLDSVDLVGGSGTFGLELIVQEFKQRMRVFQSCYEQLLRHQPPFSGTVLAECTVEPTGVVSSVVDASRSTNNPALETCVRDIVKRFRFNPAPQGGNATYRFSISFTQTSVDPAHCWESRGMGPE